jgi:hypothetical protein
MDLQGWSRIMHKQDRQRVTVDRAQHMASNLPGSFCLAVLGLRKEIMCTFCFDLGIADIQAGIL